MGLSLSQEETPPASPYEVRYAASFVPSSSPGGHKGLKNAIGENNCFLNVVVQSLWHLDSFRSSFGSDEAHFCISSSNSCVFCALKSLFAQYEFSEEKMIPPTALREALSAAFASESRFKVGEMYDAAETMVAVLQYLHCVQMGVEVGEEVVCEPPCCVHRVFGMNICSRTECQCGATSEPMTSSMFLYLVYVSEIRAQYDKRRDLRGRLDAVISVLNGLERKSCPDKEKTKCSRQNRSQRFIQNTPKVVSLSLVWSTSTPDVEDIRKVLVMMNSGELDLSELFYGVPSRTMYDFRGMIVYYGRHYYAFFFSRRRQQWLCFDDERIKVIGNTWDSVIDNCVRSHCQPAVLFYEQRPSPNSQSLSESGSIREIAIPPHHTNATTNHMIPSIGGGAPLRKSAERIPLEKHAEKELIVSRTELHPDQIGGSPSVPYKSSAPIAVTTNTAVEPEFGLRDQDKEMSTSLLSTSAGNPENFQPNSHSSDSFSEADASPVSSKVEGLIFDEVDDPAELIVSATRVDPFESETVCSDREIGKYRKVDKKIKGGEDHAASTQQHHQNGKNGGIPLIATRQHSVEYVFEVEDMHISKSNSFCIQRQFEAFSYPWRLSFERTATGYIGLCIERLDARNDILQVVASFECSVTGTSFSTTIQQTSLGPKGKVGDPYFLCPQRQKRFLAKEKCVGLSVVIRLP